MTETTMTPGQLRTLKAREAKRWNAQQRLAEKLSAAGWTVIPPADGARKIDKAQ